MTTLLDWSARTGLIDLLPLGARTASGVGPAFNVQPYTGRAMAIFESLGGTGVNPSLAVRVIQDSADGVSGWANITTDLSGTVVFPEPVTTTPALQRIWFDVGATRGFIRFSWNMAGTTPSFTFSCLLLARLT